MLQKITYGTFLVFGSACIVMVIYAIVCIPETKGKIILRHQPKSQTTYIKLTHSPGVPLESIHLLFRGNIISGAIRDTIPRYSRAKHLSQDGSDASHDRYHDDEDDDLAAGKNGSMSSHVERVNPAAKNAAYGMNNASAA